MRSLFRRKDSRRCGTSSRRNAAAFESRSQLISRRRGRVLTPGSSFRCAKISSPKGTRTKNSPVNTRPQKPRVFEGFPHKARSVWRAGLLARAGDRGWRLQAGVRPGRVRDPDELPAAPPLDKGLLAPLPINLRSLRPKLQFTMRIAFRSSSPPTIMMPSSPRRCHWRSHLHVSRIDAACGPLGRRVDIA
jgi:hypothetical protein